MLTAGPRRGTATTAVLIGLAVGLVKVALTLPVLDRYGWHRDELYFLAAAHHPAFGYVDFPPVTAWIGWVVIHIFGDSLTALRLASQVASVIGVVLVALIGRELGGSPRVQAIAAAGWAVTPAALSAGSLFHPTFFDATCWIALTYLALLILGRPEPRLWPVFGLVAGVALETKYTVVALLLALLVGLLATPSRRLLRTRGPWIAIGIMVLMMIPNLVWEAQHGWVSVAFYPSQDRQTASDTPPAAYIAQVIVFAGGMFAVAIVGVVALWRRIALRPLAVAWLFVTLFFLVERGRGYYPIPTDAVVIAAGVVAIAGWLDRPRRWWAVAGIAALNLLLLAAVLPLVVPVRTTSGMISSGDWKNSFFKDEIGWPQLTAQSARAWHGLPARVRADAVLLAQNYGEAGALAHFGPRFGLPQPLSGHLTWQYWHPRAMPQHDALTVGFQQPDLHRLCTSYRVLGRVQNRYHLDNEELHQPIAICHLRHPLGQMWARSFARSSL